MHIGTRIALFRQQKKMSQDTLAKAVNVAQTTISKWERGESEPSRAEAIRVAEALQISHGELEGLPTRAKKRQLRLMGYVGAGQAIDTQVVQPDFDSIEPPIAVPDGAECVIVRGSSMQPLLSSGAILIYWRWSDDAADFLGRLCMVNTHDNLAYVKFVERGSKPGLFDLRSLNAETLRDVRIARAAEIGAMLPYGI